MVEREELALERVERLLGLARSRPRHGDLPRVALRLATTTRASGKCCDIEQFRLVGAPWFMSLLRRQGFRCWVCELLFSSECEMSIARGNQLGCQCRAEVRASEIPQRAPPPRARRGRAAPAVASKRPIARGVAHAVPARAREEQAPNDPATKAPPAARASLIVRDQDKMARLLRPLTLRAARAPPGPPHRLPARPSPPPRRAASGDPSPAPWSAAGAERRGTPSGQPKLRPNRRPRPPRAHPVPSPRSRSSSPRRGPRPPSRWTPRSR